MQKIFIFSLFVLSRLFAQAQPLPAFISDSLEQHINRGMQDWQIPGMSVAIVKNGEVVFMKGFGVTDLETRKPVDENTLFMIGSNTKLFTATAIALLQERGKLRLDDKVQKWLPFFALKNPLASQEVTLTDLLSHRIGFETFQGDFTYWTSTLSRQDVIRKMALIDAPYGFRTQWGYCNAAFVTAGEVIPAVTGNSWEQTLRDSILAPLGMNRSTLLDAGLRQATNAARGHTLVDRKPGQIPYPNIDNLAAAGSIGSSAEEMTHWLLAQLGDGQFRGKQALPAGAFTATRTPCSIEGLDPRNARETHFYLYGLGVGINDRDGKLVYSHTGGVNGFLSSVLFIPEEKLGVVVLTNFDQQHFFQALTDEIQDAFLGLPYQGYSQKSLARFRSGQQTEYHRLDSLKAVINQHPSLSLPLEKYTGDYQNPVYGKISIKAENQQLTIHFSNHPTMTARLEHLGKDTFLCTYSDPAMGITEIPFHLKKGKVTGLTLHTADFVEFTPYAFVKK